jgi:hypothetical protein
MNPTIQPVTRVAWSGSARMTSEGGARKERAHRGPQVFAAFDGLAKGSERL